MNIALQRLISVCAGLIMLAGSSMPQSKTSPDKLQISPATALGHGPPLDPVLVGAGDIASCDDLSGAEATAEIIDKIPGTVFAVGDLAYPDGSDENFSKCYNPTWGRFKDRTRPAPGNHEYHSDGAAGYNRYFGAAAGDPTKGYYSYDLGTWHILALNSECDVVGGCGPSSPQGQWLKQELEQHPTACTLAYFHKPLFSSGGKHGDDPTMPITVNISISLLAELDDYVVSINGSRSGVIRLAVIDFLRAKQKTRKRTRTHRIASSSAKSRVRGS